MTTADATTRQVVLDGSFNFRDLGGYPTASGVFVAWRRLYRADGPHALSAADISRLPELGLRTVVDLRTVDEAEQRGRWVDHLGPVTAHHLPMFDVLPDEKELEEWVDPLYVGEHYWRMAEHGRTAIAETLRIVASDGAVPVVFHCSAGKDRTGVLAATILGILGVADETIVVDYALSRAAMERMYAWLRGRVEDPDKLARFAPAVRAAPPEAMQSFIARLRAEHGSFEGFAADLGVADVVHPLRAALLDPNTAQPA
jgi:protein-tyrosine phosphatase